MNLEELRDSCLAMHYAKEDMHFGEDIVAFRICNRIFALTNLNSIPISVSLKCNPERAVALREEYPDKIVPGYHLNKKHWNTVLLQDLPLSLIDEMILDSYMLVVEKIPKTERLSVFGEENPFPKS